MGPPRWIGEWRVDPSLDLMQRGEEVVKLEPRKTRLLMALAEKPGELVLAETLLDEVWKDVIVTPNSLYQSVAQLRRQIGDDADDPRYIVTVPRKGYRLIAPVRAADSGDDGTREATDAAPASQALFPHAGTGDVVTGKQSPAATADHAAASSTRMPAAPGEAEARPPAMIEAMVGETVTEAAQPTQPVAATESRRNRRRLIVAGGGVALTLASAGLLWRLRSEGEAQAPPLRLAVVAFRDESDVLDGPGLADALSEETSRWLSAERRLRVAARESAHTFRAGALDPAEVARQLGVSLVLEGSVQRKGESVQLRLTLHDVALRRVRWRANVVRPVAELPQLPRKIAEQTLAALGLASVAPLRRPEPSLAAFEAYVRGLQAMRQRTPEALRSARDQFEQAIAQEPGYAQAYAALALAWMATIDYDVAVGFDTAIDHARGAVRHAVELAPDAPESLTASGMLHIMLREYEQAREPLRRAIEVRPSNTQAHFWLGVTYAYQGRPREAMAHYAVAAELNPLDFQIHARLGAETLYAGFPDKAGHHFDRARDLAPFHPNPLWGRALIGYARGRLDDAVLGYRAALALEKRRSDLWLELAWVLLDLGLTERARQALREFETHRGFRGDYSAVALRRGLAAVAGGLAVAPSEPTSPTLGDRIDAAMAAVRAADRSRAREQLAAIVELWPQQHWALQGPYPLFQDRLPSLDVAVVAVWLRDRDADQWLALSREELDRLEQGGFACHGGMHQRGRLLALTGAPQAAIERLQSAVAVGWRRFWALELDPALKDIAAAHEVAALRSAQEADLERMRGRVAREAG